MSVRRLLDPAGSLRAAFTPCRRLRNLHRNRQERRKSYVKDHIHYSRNWWLQANNNFELFERSGHEREATENFAKYRYGEAGKPNWYLSVSDVRALPPLQRIPVLEAQMQRRWAVKGPTLDKVSDLLRTLECWEEARALGHIGPYDEWPSESQENFSHYLDAVVHISRALAPRHPSVIAGLLRAADVCHSLRQHRRDAVLALAESLTQQQAEAEDGAAERPIQLLPDVRQPQWHSSEQGRRYEAQSEYRRPDGPPPALRQPPYL